MSGEVMLDIRGVAKSFNEKVVHRDISIQLHSGEFLALLGSSGSGKSVLLKMIVGLEKPDAGHILFEGCDIPFMNERELYSVRVEIGYVFQSGALFDSLTVEENLRYPLKLHTDWSESRMADAINARLEMLDMRGTNTLYPSELSGGMQKRIGLARATMLDPKIVLFDEPISGLDPINVARFVRTAEKFKATRGLTGIFVTHDLAAAFALADRIALLHDGRIHAIGTTEEMRRNRDPIVRGFLSPAYRWEGVA